MPKKGEIKNRVGEKYITNEGYEIEIIDYFNSYNSTILFNDERKTVKYNVAYKEIKNGGIKNPYHKSKYGECFIGEGKYRCSIDGIEQINYDYWDGFIRRCYNKRVQEKHPTYKDATICDDWKCFQNFAEWFEKNYNYEIMQGWCLDKDILVKWNKIYSPDTCCFVPNEVNVVLTSSRAKRGDLPIGVHKSKSGKYKSQIKSNGIVKYLGVFNTPEEAFETYKIAKELYLKELADKWKDKIDLKVYQALINYKVEITD